VALFYFRIKYKIIAAKTSKAKIKTKLRGFEVTTIPVEFLCIHSAFAANVWQLNNV